MTHNKIKKNRASNTKKLAETNLHLSDDNFRLFMKDMFHKLNSFECYPLDTNGSMFFLTPDGIPSILLIRTQNDVEQLAKYINEKDPHFPTQLLEDIKTGRLLLFTVLFEGKVPISDFPKYLYKGHKLDLDLPYQLYYALLRENIPGLDNSKIVSYEDYLRSINATPPSGNIH